MITESHGERGHRILPDGYDRFSQIYNVIQRRYFHLPDEFIQVLCVQTVERARMTPAARKFLFHLDFIVQRHQSPIERNCLSIPEFPELRAQNAMNGLGAFLDASIEAH